MPTWLTRLLVVASLFVLIAGVVRLFTPREVEIEKTSFSNTNANGSVSSFSNILYVGPEISTPNSLPVFSVEENTALSNQVLPVLRETYSLRPVPNVENAWRSQSANLVKDVYSGEYSLFLSYTETNNPLTADSVSEDDVDQLAEVFLQNPENNLVTEAEAIEIASNTLESLLPAVRLSPLKNEVIQLSKHADPYYSEENTIDDDFVYAIPFTYLLNDYPLYLGKNYAQPFVVTVSDIGQVLSLRFFETLVSVSLVSEKPVVSVDQSLVAINQNDVASIIKTELDVSQEISLNTIQSGTLEEVSLEYRYDDVLGLAYPFYRFRGQITNQDELTYTVELITPAVELTNL